MQADARAFIRSGSLGFGYRPGPEGDAQSAAELCRLVAEHLSPRAAPLLRYLREPPPAATAQSQPHDQDQDRDQGATVLINEHVLLRWGMTVALRPLARSRGPVREVEVFLVSACVQSCSFCAFPQVRARGRQLQPSPAAPALVRALIDELRRRPGRSRIVLSGPDCLRHPQLDAMLDLFADEHEVGLELLGPLTRLSEPELFDRVTRLPSFRGVRLSILGASHETHDRVVGRPGAHAQVMAVLERCIAAGVRVGLHTVLTPENVAELPALLRQLARLGLDTRLNLYHPESWSGPTSSWRVVDLERVVLGPDALRSACESLSEADARAASCHNIAHCWLPARLRPLLVRPVADRQDNFQFEPGCRGCPEQPRCPGVPRPAVERLGPDACVRPL